MCLEAVPVTIYTTDSVDLSLINLISHYCDLSVIKPDKDNTNGIYAISSHFSLIFINSLNFYTALDNFFQYVYCLLS